MNNELITMNNEPKTTLHRDERAQKPLIMQNEPKFKKAQMNASTVLTNDYDNWTLGERGKNEPKTNPKRTQTKPIAKNQK